MDDPDIRSSGARADASTGDDPLAACTRALASAVRAPLPDATVTGAGDGGRGGSGGAAPLPSRPATRGSGSSRPRSSAGDPAERGPADRVALRRAHHDATLHRRRAPREGFARRLFGDLERERVEALGANRWRGVRVNLDAARAAERRARVPADPVARLVAAVLDRVRAALRDGKAEDVAVSAATVPDGAAGQGPAERVATGRGGGGAVRARDALEARVERALAETLPSLAERLEDQTAFADAALALIARLGIGERAAEEERGADTAGATDDDAAVRDAPDLGEATEEETARAESGEERSDDETGAEPAASDSAEAPDARGETRDAPPDAEAGVDPRPGTAAAPAEGYRVWTRAFDEIVDARALADATTLDARRAELDRHIARHARAVRRLATRLERLLLARRRRAWRHDLDEGQIDPARLARLVGNPLAPLAFRAETESAFRDTTVTLLIDNSRSMIGRPITVAAACADILAQTLERAGVGVEVLGFTTVTLHGGRAEASWEAAGRPAAPGRLADLRHIVYKSADASYRSARRALALMLERDVLKQNVDGEALLWAASRLERRSAERRILVVVSDGAPVDATTLAVNPRDYLERHLDAVIARIERRGAIELAAIGIGHDVERFYRQAIVIRDPRELGTALLGRLERLFRQGLQ